MCVCVEKMGEREKRLHNEPVVARVKIMCVTHDDGKNGIFSLLLLLFVGNYLFFVCLSLFFSRTENNL